jgi:hypothetical protein
MTHAAAATRRLCSPRRRPDGPAAWERVATLALSPVAGLVLANARTIATTQRRPERWLIRFDIQIATIAVVASIASFVGHDGLTPGEPVAAGALFLLAPWVVALARTIVRGGDVTFTEEDS